jgi:glycosyltransferase involved in cell wall biosynthesis
MTNTFSAIHQFHSGTSPGDAITNQMFALQSEFQKMGFVSNIYSQHIDYDVQRSVRHIDSFVPSENELLLVHHSMGHHMLNQIIGFSNPIVTVYHNITPARELDDPSYRYFSHIGRHQLALLAQRSVAGIADSHYNRKEMFLAGFKDVEVIPVRTDFREYEIAGQLRHPERDWLFVGRIAPNKGQLEIIQAFNHYHHNVDKSARLHLIGDHKMRSYVDSIGEEIESLNLEAQIDAPGKLDDIALIHRYARAGVFVSLSRHEGFGVPLLEAMAAQVPVVALASSAVTETMGGAGVLLESSDPHTVSRAVEKVMTDSDYRNEVLWRQNRRLEKITTFNVAEALHRVLQKISGKTQTIRVQVQGPIESSYSLAILNREAALQLDAVEGFDVSVFPTEGPGDYPPNLDAIASIPGLSTMFGRGRSTSYPDVIIRQMFPPRVRDTTAGITLQYFGWEESLVPQEFAHDFNQHVQRIMTMSSFVKDALVDSGVTIPIDVVGVGVRPPVSNPQAEIPEISDVKRVRLLHISSAFPRKGIDVLLNAYFAEFTSDDDVSLVLKTFPNQHNTVAEQLNALVQTHPHAPHVVWIDRDLPLDHLGNLYDIADAYVHPARGEGFGLPVAEAMLARVPVISTDTSGLADFVDSSTAAVIPSERTPAASHVSIPGSEWFEPNREALQHELRSLYQGSDADTRSQRVNAAHLKISSDFSWSAVGKRIQDSVNATLIKPTSIKVSHLSTFNSRCGIAEYTSLLRDGLPQYVASSIYANRDAWPIDLDEEEDVVRIWEQARHQDVQNLVTALNISDSDVVHLQYNYGFFAMEDLTTLINHVQGVKPVIVTLHRTIDLDRGHEIVSLAHAADALKKVSAIVVHEEHDVRRLSQFGIVDNVVLIPHGAMPFKGQRSGRRYSSGSELKIGTFGFLLPHKGLEVTLTALHSLNYRGIPTSLTALCSIHPDPSSQAAHDRVLEMINRWDLSSKVRLDTGFKSVNEIHSELDDVDILVLPYTETEESSSGVLAMLLGIGKPIITTDLAIFSGSRDALITIPAPAQSDDLTAAISDLIHDPQLMANKRQATAKRAQEISWGAIGEQTADLYASVVR